MPTAVVTGAGSGLGRAIALDLAGRNYLIWATDIDAAAAAETAAMIGPGTNSSELDVTDEEACRTVASNAAGAGSLDLWVNNAGVLYTGPSWQQDAAVRKKMIEVNAIGTMNGTVAALEEMLPADRGHVINVISLAGLVTAPGVTNYAASKHAAIAFTIGTQLDLRNSGSSGIHLSAVCPDGIWTPMLEDKLDDPTAAPPFSGQLLTAERVAAEIGKLTERPRPLLVLPRWRGPMVRLLDLFPRLTLRLVPLLMRDGRRRQRRYKRRIEAGRWP
jgi:NAD(P)-dependent dehydrogenase (short-subunit alcohol dehydrogenase family)